MTADLSFNLVSQKLSLKVASFIRSNSQKHLGIWSHTSLLTSKGDEYTRISIFKGINLENKERKIKMSYQSCWFRKTNKMEIRKKGEREGGREGGRKTCPLISQGLMGQVPSKCMSTGHQRSHFAVIVTFKGAINHQDNPLQQATPGTSAGPIPLPPSLVKSL